MFLHTLSLLLFAASAAAQAAAGPYEQCGGVGFTGPKTCVSGNTCTFQNEYYHQCIPGTGVPTTTGKPPVQTTPPPGTVSTTNTGGGGGPTTIIVTNKPTPSTVDGPPGNGDGSTTTTTTSTKATVSSTKDGAGGTTTSTTSTATPTIPTPTFTFTFPTLTPTRTVGWGRVKRAAQATEPVVRRWGRRGAGGL